MVKVHGWDDGSLRLRVSKSSTWHLLPLVAVDDRTHGLAKSIPQPDRPREGSTPLVNDPETLSSKGGGSRVGGGSGLLSDV